MPIKLTQEAFIARANALHEHKYDYTKTVYKSTNFPVTVTCPEHGDFVVSAREHMRSSGCPICAIPKKLMTRYQRVFTTESFVKRAREVHGDKYTYEKTVYIKTSVKVDITCPIHGVFSQAPHNHLIGCGCTQCGWDSQRVPARKR